MSFTISIGVVPYRQASQRYGDTTALTIPHATMQHIPYRMPTQRWGDIVDSTPAPLAEYYDPSSVPFVALSEVQPPVGAINVDNFTSLVIPCGDRIAASEDQSVRLVDMLLSGAQALEPKGLNPLATVITVQYGSSPPFVVFQNGTPIPGWLASVDLNNYAGTHRGIDGVGRTYTLSCLAGLPSLSVITVTIDLEDHGKKYNIDTYSFTTTSLARTVGISDLFIVAHNVIMITFASNLAANHALFDVTNYSVTNLSGGSNGVVSEVLPTYNEAPNQVFFKIDQLVPGDMYRFSIADRKIYTQFGQFVAAIDIEWGMRRTKVDSALGSLASMYNKQVGGVVRSLVEAMMISDEKIGGNY